MLYGSPEGRIAISFNVVFLLLGNYTQGTNLRVQEEDAMSQSKNKPLKTRNHLAVWMWQNKGNAAGCHGDKRKEQSRKACRGKSTRYYI